MEKAELHSPAFFFVKQFNANELNIFLPKHDISIKRYHSIIDWWLLVGGEKTVNKN